MEIKAEAEDFLNIMRTQKKYNNTEYTFSEDDIGNVGRIFAGYESIIDDFIDERGTLFLFLKERNLTTDFISFYMTKNAEKDEGTIAAEEFDNALFDTMFSDEGLLKHEHMITFETQNTDEAQGSSIKYLPGGNIQTDMHTTINTKYFNSMRDIKK